jgi:tRNA U34 5-carboxymethylaminomethyl modifying GTPase MnmE/TrmE
MILESSLKEFYKSLNEISIINNSLEEKRELLKRCVYSFNSNIQNMVIAENIKKQNVQIASLLEETINMIKSCSNNWIENFEEMLEREKFRSELANYFIVIIFGKVKAGKSSLGNFIANNRLASQKVEFFKYDEAGEKSLIKKLEEIEEESFATNNLECTVEIQGFKLDGMAWIDTPGLGSMVKENGDLAKEYIQSADYIIYPTSSDSPLQLDEQEQLKELFEQNKKVTICITKSDEKEEDECECGSEDGCENCNEGMIYLLKNKSITNREMQEAFVKEEIEKLIPKDKEAVLGDIYSISTHTAKIGMEINDKDIFENSNIPKFYNLIAQVVKEKASKLKEETPYDGLKSFVDFNILGSDEITKNSSIKNIRNEIYNLEITANDSLERFEILKENSNNDLELEIENIIAKYSSQIDKTNSKEIFSEIDNEINNKIKEVINQNISEILTKFDGSLKSLAATFNSNEFIIDDVFEKIKIDNSTRNKAIVAGIFGIAATIGIAFATGGASLLVQGATMTAGTVAAGYIGGKAGEMTSSIEYETVKVGDNKEEVLLKFKASRLENSKLLAHDIYNQMQNQFFTPLKSTINDINSNINKFEAQVKTIF